MLDVRGDHVGDAASSAPMAAGVDSGTAARAEGACAESNGLGGEWGEGGVNSGTIVVIDWCLLFSAASWGEGYYSTCRSEGLWKAGRWALWDKLKPHNHLSKKTHTISTIRFPADTRATCRHWSV